MAKSIIRLNDGGDIMYPMSYMLNGQDITTEADARRFFQNVSLISGNVAFAHIISGKQDFITSTLNQTYVHLIAFCMDRIWSKHPSVIIFNSEHIWIGIVDAVNFTLTSKLIA